MAIKTIVTRGYGNGTFSGTIPLVVLRGYVPDIVINDDGNPSSALRVIFRDKRKYVRFRDKRLIVQE